MCSTEIILKAEWKVLLLFLQQLFYPNGVFRVIISQTSVGTKHHICSFSTPWGFIGGSATVPQLVKKPTSWVNPRLFDYRGSQVVFCGSSHLLSLHCAQASRHASVWEKGGLTSTHVRNLWPLGWSLSRQHSWGWINALTPEGKITIATIICLNDLIFVFCARLS